MKDILVLSHCILNNASKVEMDESELAEEYRERNKLIECALKSGVQFIQLPCPEFILYGSQRWGHVKNQFDHPFYRNECVKMIAPLIMQLEEYASHPESFNLMGIVSVEGSPSCGYGLTCIGQWKGEIGTDEKHIIETVASLEMTEEPGVFMEVLESELRKVNLDVPIITMKQAIERLKS